MVVCVLFLKKAKASLFSIGKDFFIKKTSVLLGFPKLFVFLPRLFTVFCKDFGGKADILTNRSVIASLNLRKSQIFKQSNKGGSITVSRVSVGCFHILYYGLLRRPSSLMRNTAAYASFVWCGNSQPIV